MITDQGMVGKVVHTSQQALTIREWEQDLEGYLTPTPKHSAHTLNNVQRLLTQFTKARGKRLVVGPSEGAPPLLKNPKLTGKGLHKYESKTFYRALQGVLTKKQKLKLQELCSF